MEHYRAIVQDANSSLLFLKKLDEGPFNARIWREKKRRFAPIKLEANLRSDIGKECQE